MGYTDAMKSLRSRHFVQQNAIAFCLLFYCSLTFAGTPDDVYRTVRSVRVLNSEQAARRMPVKVDAVVTHANPYIGDFFIDDGTAPIYVSPGNWKDLAAGDRVRLEAVTSAGGFAPCLVATKVEKFGIAPLPDPQPYDLSLDDSRWLDAHYVQCWPIIESVSEAANYTYLRASTSKGSVVLMIPGKQHLEQARALLYSPVRVRGVCVPSFSERKVINRPARIFVQSLDDITVLPQAAVDLTAGRTTLLGSLFHFIPDAHPQTRRVRTLGTVTAAVGDRTLYIRDATGAARVRLLDPTKALPGDVVEVVGMLVIEKESLTLERASAVIVEHVPAPKPTLLTLRQIANENHAFDFIEVEGLASNVRESAKTPTAAVGKSLLLSDGPASLDIHLPAAFDLSSVQTGSRVAAAGILGGGSDETAQLLVLDPAAVRVLAPPPPIPFWNSDRVGVLIVGAIAVAVAIGAWAYTLRRRIQQQTRLLQAQFARQSLLEAQMRQSQKLEALGRLAGGIAHDFNNLLTVIIGSSELLKLDAGIKKDSAELVSNIYKAGDRAAALTRQMLVFSRGRPVSLSPIDLNAAVNDSAQMVSRMIGEHIQIRVVLAKERLQILASEDLINQILMNFGANARDAIADKGTITITTAVLPGDKIRLSFADTGHGMDAATRERIFEPFFTTKEVGKGTGLGLATVFGIVKTLGAEITCDSEPGKGTLFNIDFQRITQRLEFQSAPAAAKPGAAEKFKDLTVLLVEDNTSIADLAERELLRHGCSVLKAHTPHEALELWRTHSAAIGLLVTDVVMPGMNGRELCEKLHAQKPGLPVLYMSGYAADELIQRGIQQDRIVLLQKPFTGSQLMGKALHVLETHTGKK